MTWTATDLRPSLQLVFLVLFAAFLTGCHRRARVVYAVPAASVLVAPPVTQVEPQVFVTPAQPEGQWVWTGQKYQWQAAVQAPIRPVLPQSPAPVVQQTYVIDRRATRRANRAYRRALKRHRRDLRRHRKLMRRYHHDMRRQGVHVQGGVVLY